MQLASALGDDQMTQPSWHMPVSPAFVGKSAAVAASAFLLSGCEGVLDPKGPIAAAERSILFDATLIMLAIIVPTMSATLGFAWWYRESNTKAHYRPDWAYSGRVELVVWSVPLLTIIFLGGIAWVGSHQLDPAVPIASDKKTLEVQVVSLDWKWLFIYPEQNVAAVNQLVVPAGTPVHFTLTSSSVWNSFFVPQLGSQIYTMKGMATQLNLLADEAGTFHGLSTHFSGDGFSDMQFDVEAVSPDAVRRLGQDAQAPGRARRGGLRELAKQSIADAPTTYGAVDAGLFEQVVTAKLAPGPGPKRRRRPTSRPSGGTDHAGQAHLGRDPARPADPARRVRARRSADRERPRLGRARRPSALPLARVDHQRRPQADRRDVLAARRW